MAVTETAGTAPDATETMVEPSVLATRLRNATVPLATAAVLLLIWQFGVRLFEVPMYIAPAPSDVIGVFREDFPLLLRNF